MNVQVDRDLIKSLRLRHSYSQERLAEIVGVNLRTIQRIEKEGVASLQTRAALARALGVDPETFDVAETSAGDAGTSEQSTGLLPAIVSGTGVLLLVGGALLARSVVNYLETRTLEGNFVAGPLIVLGCFLLLALNLPLSRWRLYFVVTFAAVGTLVTPPDWFSAIALTALLWLLFELSLLATRAASIRSGAAGKL